MLYTIGHTNHSHEEFLKLLKQHSITYLLDVRSTPYSQYTCQFNKDVISEVLVANGIKYYYMGKFFGARPDDKSLYTSDNYLDFEKMRSSELFKKGLDNVMKGLAEGNNIVLMCTEKDPMDCHRAIMVSRGFTLKGIEVNHILPDGKLQSQKELDERLLNLYYSDRNQISFLSNISEIPEEDLLVEAYKKRNAEIGYHNEQL